MAFSHLNSVVGNIGWANVNEKTIKRHALDFQKFDAACQKGLDGLKRESTREYLRKRLGAIFSGPDELAPFCTAFRITDRRAVTAEHCLWFAGKRREEDKLRFSLLGHPSQRFALDVLSAPALGQSRIADKNDIAVIELQSEAADSLPSIQFMNRFDLNVPKDKCGKAYVLIPGIFRPALILQDELLPGDWAKAIRVDATDTCVRRSGIFNEQCLTPDAKGTSVELFYRKEDFRNKRCIVVNCQTYPGMSGAPIIGYDNEENTLFSDGILIRSGAAAPGRRNTCGDIPGMNIGITYSKDSIEILIGE